MNIVQLSHGIIERLKRAHFEVISEWAVGIKYIEGLKEVSWPADANYSDPKFSEQNAQYLVRIFPDPKTHDAFYGKAVFDNWILFEDTTYDTLHKSAEGHPLFLDASIALGGLEWDQNHLNWAMVIPDRSIYLVGFVTDPQKFVPWLDKIERIDRAKVEKMTRVIPKEWNVPSSYIRAINEFFASTNEDFLKMFHESIDFKTGFFADAT